MSLAIKNSWISLVFFAFALVAAQAQDQTICQEGDCSPAVFTIKMDEPTFPPNGQFTKQRTERIQEAYLAFLKIKKTYNQREAWKSKYAASQLGGKSCLRHYQLESYFSHE